MRIRSLLFFLIGLIGHRVVAQSQGTYIPLNADVYHLIERYEIRSGYSSPGFHSQVKPYLRRPVVQLAERLLADAQQPFPRTPLTYEIQIKPIYLSGADRFNLNYLRNDSWEWANDSTAADSPRPLFNALYRKQTDLYHIQNSDFQIHVNPVFYGATGLGRDVPDRTFINTRGLEIRGSIGRKLSFYTYMTDTQLRLPGYFTERVKYFNALPGEGYFKPFKNQANSFDFFTARAYLTFDPIKQINLQFGHDKVFIGNGYRSVILSDYSAPFLFLKITTQLGRFHYQNLFGEIINSQRTLPYGTLAPKKFMAFHHLSVNFGQKQNFNFGVFEAIIHSRDKSQGYFDVSYLNPVIFYRAIEGQKNSPDNALLGFDFRWNFLRHFSLYGQAMLDEFRLSDVRAGRGFWANKFAAQAGLKYIDVLGVPNLDLQGELNIARPYTYQHIADLTNYVHQNMPLAHPLGANFIEFVGTARYQFRPRLHLTATFVGAQYGADRPGQNWGGNPLLNYTSRQKDTYNSIGQGRMTNLTMLDALVSYQVKHNIFVDVRQILRNQDAAGNSTDRRSSFTSIALRINIAQRNLSF